MQQCVYETKIHDINNLQKCLTQTWFDFWTERYWYCNCPGAQLPEISCACWWQTLWTHAVKLLFICIMWFVRTFYETVNIQMMHGCKWNIQICCPEVDMSSRGRSPCDDISTEGQHIWMFHEQACFICFVVWPTTSKYKIQGPYAW